MYRPVISRRASLRSLSLALGILIWPHAARAQESGRTYRLGHLTSLARGTPQYVVFLEELRRMGFMVEVDARGYGQPPERFADIARELVNAKVDLIVCAGDTAIRAAQRSKTAGR